MDHSAQAPTTKLNRMLFLAKNKRKTLQNESHEAHKKAKNKAKHAFKYTSMLACILNKKSVKQKNRSKGKKCVRGIKKRAID